MRQLVSYFICCIWVHCCWLFPASLPTHISTGAFVICWTPGLMTLLLDGLLGKDSNANSYEKFCLVIAECNSLVNPIIYSLRDDEMRMTFKSILCCLCRRNAGQQRERSPVETFSPEPKVLVFIQHMKCELYTLIFFLFGFLTFPLESDGLHTNAHADSSATYQVPGAERNQEIPHLDFFVTLYQKEVGTSFFFFFSTVCRKNWLEVFGVIRKWVWSWIELKWTSRKH